jgi:hypothetical protein
MIRLLINLQGINKELTMGVSLISCDIQIWILTSGPATTIVIDYAES